MYYGSRFPKYVSVAEKREKAEKTMAKLRKKQGNLEPVILTGNKITATWWGKAWNENLEKYADYSNRIGRGRSYVRHGAVLDLKITAGKVTALVQGSRSQPYKVDVTIKPVPEKNWAAIKSACRKNLDSLQELLEGKFPKTLEELFTNKGTGLFPSPKEIKFDCSCPDWADMCKHVAAVCYGIGARLDQNPGLFFSLRQADMDDLISGAVKEKTKQLLKKSKTTSSRILKGVDVEDMFGIELAKPEQAVKKGRKKTVK
ncbi:MAG: hypothetical protein A2293_15400 [Elusimicrobia bacterium RIFOXYB2_FULL_49_7]|nr:MAG: hypothetical protein A2293_15400 [Elusimicrobia bacterium RIFOXYB2_FULL_49_7]